MGGNGEVIRMAKKNLKKYRVNSFFAGIGGFDVAFEKCGFKTIMLCEIDSFCNKVLNKHWPKTKKLDNIITATPEDIDEAEVWCGGFPCQDISLARGRNGRPGLDGERSGLFYTYADLISEKAPSVVVIENVQGLFSSNGGRDFGIILQRMTSMGYCVAWRLVNSRYFGVPQSRTRVYICCWKSSVEKALRVMFDQEGAHVIKNERKGFLTECISSNEFPKVPEVSYCIAATTGRHTGTDWSRTYVVCEDGIRRLTPIECERLQGFPDDWTLIENEVDINSLRYKAIGNAVSVPVVQWMASRIHKELDSKAPSMSKESVKEFVPEFSKSEWSSEKLSDIDFSDVTKEYKWEWAGIACDNSYIQGKVAPAPYEVKKSKLIDLIQKERQEDEFYISPNASEGILRRVDRAGRTLFQPLREALEKEINKTK